MLGGPFRPGAASLVAVQRCVVLHSKFPEVRCRRSENRGEERREKRKGEKGEKGEERRGKERREEERGEEKRGGERRYIYICIRHN